MSANRRWVLATVVSLIAVPMAASLVGAISYHVANRSNHTMVVAGRKRDYLLYVPPSYDPANPTPLVISLHGAGLWGAAQQKISQWNRVADRAGFLVVYPSGARYSDFQVWTVGDSGVTPDVRFIAALIDTLAAQYSIDRSRIYANGLSNGGGMAAELACKLPDRIAAVGMVGAALTVPSNWCPERRPVPAIWFHGTSDAAAPYRGGTSWVATTRPFPSIPTFVATWSRANHCGDTPVDSAVTADITRRTYTRCAGDATVVLYTIRGGGHSWPGGGPLPEAWVGPTNREIDASSVMWAFFQMHPLQR